MDLNLKIFIKKLFFLQNTDLDVKFSIHIVF